MANIQVPTTNNPILRLDKQLCFALYSSSLAMQSIYRAPLKAIGLTYPQYLVMLVLWEAEPLTISAIGERLYLDSATLTPLIKRLISNNLVSKTRGIKDERQVYIALTGTGQMLKDQAEVVAKQAFCATGYDIEELETVKQILFALQQRLNKLNETFAQLPIIF